MICVAQTGPTPMSKVANNELFKDRSKMYFNEEYYVIDGKKVLGSPFLYREWLHGIVTTEDGRTFTDYKLKYNAFHQTLFFLNGNDSLEVNDPIKYFTLMVQPGDTLFNYTFIHTNQIRKEKKPLFYELILQDSVYHLLKYNRKIVAEAGNSLPAADGRKIFQLEISYFLYQIKSKKLVRLKSDGSNIADALGIGRDKVNELKLANSDFSIESEIIRFFKSYFANPLK